MYRHRHGGVDTPIKYDDSSVLPLSRLYENEEGTVYELRGGRMLVMRLADLGLTYGTKVKVINRGLWGPIEINVRGSNLALGRGVAEKVYVIKNIEMDKEASQT